MRVLFTSSPALGHVHPMVALAMALAGRGRDVWWVVAAEACPRLEAVGFETFPAGLSVAERGHVPNVQLLRPVPFDAVAGDGRAPVVAGPDDVGAVLEGLW